MALLDEITLDMARGRPRIEIVFGQAHVGNYRLFLWDAEGVQCTDLARGHNVDHVLDSFEVDAEPADLNQRILSFEMMVQAAEAKPGQIYNVTITVRQQDTVCAGGVVQESGPFKDVKALVGFRRFKAV